MTAPTPDDEQTVTSAPAPRSRSKLRRRINAMTSLTLALLVVGALYMAFAPQPQSASGQPDDAAMTAQGQQLYTKSCITCHGSNLQGVTDRGPSLIGVGDAAVYFQVASGRMPLAAQGAQAPRKPPLPQFDPKTPQGQSNLAALGAYVQANGGGPRTPAGPDTSLRGDDPARGGQLFRLNCASCHNFTGVGGALSSGKYAPPLNQASNREIYTALLSGPQNMPRFSEQQLTPAEKKDIIAYVESVTAGNNPGGSSLGGIGPTSEGIVAFVVGMAALVGFAMWLGAKS